MTKAAAIHAFWSSFGVTAYEENSVPTDAAFPYITYEFLTDAFESEAAMVASLWFRDSSWVPVNAKAEEISADIGRGGKLIPCDGGAIWIKRGSPFAQSLGDDTDDMIKRKYINITAEFLTAD